nr:amidohydrolase family protein [Acidaminobacter sp. JC074]
MISDLGKGDRPVSDHIIDLEGKTLMPGFINAHMHPLPAGMEGTTIPLFECDTLEKVTDMIKRHVKTNDETFLLAEGYLSMLIDFDNKAFKIFNDISHDHPIAIKYITGHGMIVNQNVMDRLGLNHYFITGEKMSEANNLFSDQAVDGFIHKVSNEAVSKGFTTLHTLVHGELSDNRDVATWVAEEKDRQALKVQVLNFVQTMDVDLVMNYDLPRIGGCVCLDGTPIEGSAAFTEPYEDGHEAELYIKDSDLFEMVAKAHRNDMQCAFHAVGDKAVHQLIDCYQKVSDIYGKKDLRHRIEHVDLISDEKLRQAAELGLVFSVQPGIGYLYGKGFDKILGKEREKLLNSLRRYKEAGVTLAGGTDSPVTPLDALLGIHAAVHASSDLRKLSIKEALEMFTLGGAYAGHEEDLKGSLEIGKQADLVVLSDDPYEAESIKDISVEMTVVAGELVFKKE